MSNLEQLKKAIEDAKKNKGIQEGITFYFEGVEPGSWSDFLIKTDVGQIIAQNDQVNFKDSYGKRIRGAFIKLDEHTFAEISLLGSGRTGGSHVGISFFPKEQINAKTKILIDYDRDDYMKRVEEARKALLEFEDFSFEDKRKQKLFEKLKENPNNSNLTNITNSEINLMFDMISNGELNWKWVPDQILHTPQFKNKLINYVINETPKDEKSARHIEDLISVDDGDSLWGRNYFFDEDILENKEFIENLNSKFFNGQHELYDDPSKYESGSEAITYAIFSRYRKDGSFENKEFIEEKLDLIAKLVEENDGDLGFLKGIIPYAVKHNLDNLDKILSISSDQKTISLIIKSTRHLSSGNLEVTKKLLAVSTDKKNIEILLDGMNKDDLVNPEIMLGIVESCPNFLEVFKEKYDNLENWKKGSNLFFHLEYNKEFQEGLFNILQKRIQQSKIETRYREGYYRKFRASYRTEYIPGKTYHEFEEGSPMREFEDKMSSETKKIIAEIAKGYYREQQEQLENPEYNFSELYDISYEATRWDGGFAYAVKKAEEIIQRHLEEQGKAKQITPAAAAKSALKSKTTTQATAEARANESKANEPRTSGNKSEDNGERDDD